MSKEKTWIDVDLTFSKKSSGDLNDIKGINAIKMSIKNIIETMVYQRRMLPDFAGRYQDLLFEPLDSVTANQLGEEILEIVSRWEPRININNVNIHMEPDKNKYSAVVTFYLRNAYETETVEVDIIRKG